MGKTAFLFPGQGVQCFGMGKDFYENFEIAKQVYDLAGEASGLDVAKICFEENELLNITEYTQIALLATEVAILKVLQGKGVKADLSAGLSLGEYGALAAGEVMDLKDLFYLIRKRGLYMQEAYPQGGGMTAVLGLDVDAVEEVLKTCDGIVSVANDNCPGQIVITGEKTSVDQAAALLSEKGAKKCVPLVVSGPFHSKLLEGAGEKLAQEMKNVSFKDPVIPYVCNLEASLVDSKERIPYLLEKQVSGKVRFRESLQYLCENGVDRFIEIGPGKSLAGFLKRINRDVEIINISTVSDLEKL